MGVVLSRLRDSYGLQTPKTGLGIHHFACLVHTGLYVSLHIHTSARAFNGFRPLVNDCEMVKFVN